MLRFEPFRDGEPLGEVELSGAYLFGQDAVPIRAEIAAQNSQITCSKRAPGAAGLSLLWPTPPIGAYLLATTRLPDVKGTFNLNLELARARMMLITRKREDWGLWDYPTAEALETEFDEVRKIFIDAVKLDAVDRPAAAKLADDALVRGVALGERTTLFHSKALFARRRKAHGFGAGTLGCVVDLASQSEAYRSRLAEAVDCIALPVPWKQLEPKERDLSFQATDAWVEWAVRHGLPVQAGPLVSFDPAHTPDWLYIWEHDYETLRDMIYEYVQQVVGRYAKHVQTWKVVSGVHAQNHFNLSFEQMMELTRISCSLVKKLSPRSQVVVDVVLPWGEYYARNQRTIPPMLYADMCVQAGVKFDAFGVQLYMGAADDGMYVRDLMQLSDLLDQFASFGKPVIVTACQAPSDVAPDRWDSWQGQAHAEQAGVWHETWSEAGQADWLEAFYQVALSKPYVDCVCWRDLADYEGHFLPHGGLCRADLTPKPAFDRLRRLKALLANRPAANHASRRRKAPENGNAGQAGNGEENPPAPPGQ